MKIFSYFLLRYRIVIQQCRLGAAEGSALDSHTRCKTKDSGSLKECPVGYYRKGCLDESCIPCEAGTYKDEDGDDVGLCKPCTASSY